MIDLLQLAREAQTISQLLESQGFPDEPDPATIGALLGLLEGLASDGRQIKLWFDEQAHLEISQSEGSVEFTGPRLATCLVQVLQGPPPETNGEKN